MTWLYIVCACFKSLVLVYAYTCYHSACMVQDLIPTCTLLSSVEYTKKAVVSLAAMYSYTALIENTSIGYCSDLVHACFKCLM